MGACPEKVERAGPPGQREQGQTPLRRAAALQGVRQPLCSHDPVLERKAACGVRLQALDSMVWEYLSTVREERGKERKQLAQLQKTRALRKPVLDTRVFTLQERIQKLEQEVDNISMEYLKGN